MGSGGSVGRRKVAEEEAFSSGLLAFAATMRIDMNREKRRDNERKREITR
jgi:hypothetical protein